MKSLWNRVAALPRVAKWLTAFVVIMLAWFLVGQPVLDRTDRLAGEADQMESQLRLLADYESDSSETARIVRDGVRAFGRPRLPSDSRANELEVQRAVSSVLDDHSVDDRNMTERSGSLNGAYESDLAIDSGSYKIERSIVEVTFEATQETVIQVIADLEQSPAITAVTRVKIDKATATWSTPEGEEQSERKVRATIAAEAWVRVKRGSGGTSGEEGVS